MYEGKIVPEGGLPATAEGAGVEEGLRALSWGELVARLGAARDFRRLMEDAARAGGASFNASSARHLAALGEGKPGINRFALTNRKMANCMASVARAAASDDRGT